MTSADRELETKAGDIVIWDGRIWHGALGNKTERSRWSLIATFARWWVKQNFDITGTLPQRLYEAMNDDEKAILGYCSRPPRDEHERLDMKAGHAQLLARVADYDRGDTANPNLDAERSKGSVAEDAPHIVAGREVVLQ